MVSISIAAFDVQTRGEKEERIEIISGIWNNGFTNPYSWGRILQNKLWLYNWNRHFLTSLISSFITVFIIITTLISTISILFQLKKKKKKEKEGKVEGKKFRNILNLVIHIYVACI